MLMREYLVELSGRYDGSWKFPKDNRWGFFPSISAGWRISEEKFYKNSVLSNWMNNVKIRASYGEMGDDNVGGYGDFDYLGGYTFNQGSAIIARDPFGSIDGTFIKGFVCPPDSGDYGQLADFEDDQCGYRPGLPQQPDDSGIQICPAQKKRFTGR